MQRRSLRLRSMRRLLCAQLASLDSSRATSSEPSYLNPHLMKKSLSVRRKRPPKQRKIWTRSLSVRLDLVRTLKNLGLWSTMLTWLQWLTQLGARQDSAMCRMRLCLRKMMKQEVTKIVKEKCTP